MPRCRNKWFLLHVDSNDVDVMKEQLSSGGKQEAGVKRSQDKSQTNQRRGLGAGGRGRGRGE